MKKIYKYGISERLFCWLVGSLVDWFLILEEIKNLILPLLLDSNGRFLLDYHLSLSFVPETLRVSVFDAFLCPLNLLSISEDHISSFSSSHCGNRPASVAMSVRLLGKNFSPFLPHTVCSHQWVDCEHNSGDACGAFKALSCSMLKRKFFGV